MFHPQGPSLRELARQALSSTERGYDLLAGKFEHTPFRTPDDLLQAVVSELEPAERILDLCCGTGAGLAALAPLLESPATSHQRLVGLDFSHGMLEEARRQLEQQLGPAIDNGTPLELVQGDALAMSFVDEFDLITCFGALGHFPPGVQSRLFDNVYRALAPGGRFAFVTAERPPASSPRLWLAGGFDAVMRLRNLLWRPPFVMYYLNMLLPEVAEDLEQHGFEVEVRDGFWSRSHHAKLVLARRP